MSGSIRLRAGDRAGMPRLADREPAYVRDEQALYVGTPDGNVKVCSAATEGKVTALEQTVASKLTANKVAAQTAVASDADAATIAAALNSLIAAMKSSGVMNT